jgi:hypothetical protein
MGAGIFIIAILGCGEADASCEPVRTLDTRYESQAACTAATNDALLRSGDVDYPVVVAQCVAAGSRPEGLAPAQFELPEPGRLDAPNSPVRS